MLNEAAAPPALVSFVVVAYNQAQYIREAVENALRQTYSPMEIILSDDCSTDETYDILVDMAAEYKGPHEVVLNRNKKNLGLAGHLNAVAGICRGDIMILAAGDDISRIDRTAILVKMFTERPDAFAVYSRFNDLTTCAEFCGTLRAKRRNSFEILFNGGGIGKGATYAYRRKCFLWPRPLPDNILSEDKFLPLRAAVLGSVFEVDAPLVAYRKPPGRLGAKIKRSGNVALKRPEHKEALLHDLCLARKEGVMSGAYATALKAVFAYRMVTEAELPEKPLILRRTLRILQRLARNRMRDLLRMINMRHRPVFLSH